MGLFFPISSSCGGGGGFKTEEPYPNPFPNPVGQS